MGGGRREQEGKKRGSGKGKAGKGTLFTSARKSLFLCHFKKAQKG